MGLTCMINEAFAAIFIKQVILSLDIANSIYYMIYILVHFVYSNDPHIIAENYGMYSSIYLTYRNKYSVTRIYYRIVVYC